MLAETKNGGKPPSTNRPRRLPRFERVRNPPAMVLTERDSEILRQVYSFRVMTREQIEKLLFQPDHGQDHPTKTSRLRERLKLLYQHGYLERIAMPVDAHMWALRPVYRLTGKGAAIIGPELGFDPRSMDYWGKGDDKDGRSTEASLLFLNHALAINDIRLAVMLATSSKGYHIEQWTDDSQLKKPENRDYVSIRTESGSTSKVAVIPDAYFIIHLGDRRAHFLLELDRATMSNQRWRRRILAYRKYVESGRYGERFHTTSLRILTVTTTKKRLGNLLQTTFKAGGADVFWFTTLAEAINQDILVSPIWLTANDKQASPPKVLIGDEGK